MVAPPAPAAPTPAVPVSATTNNLPIGTPPSDPAPQGSPVAPSPSPQGDTLSPRPADAEIKDANPAQLTTDGYTCTDKDIKKKYTLTLNNKEYEQEIKGIKTVDKKTYFKIPYPSVKKPSCLTDNVPNRNSCKETTCTQQDLASSFGEQYAATYWAPWQTGSVTINDNQPLFFIVKI